MKRSIFIGVSDYNSGKLVNEELRTAESELSVLSKITSSIYFDIRQLDFTIEKLTDFPTLSDLKLSPAIDWMNQFCKQPVDSASYIKTIYSPKIWLGDYYVTKDAPSIKDHFGTIVLRTTQADKIQKINSKIRKLKVQFRKFQDVRLLKEIKMLLLDLRTIFGRSISIKKTQVKFLRIQRLLSTKRNLREIISVFVRRFFYDDICSGDDDSNAVLTLYRTPLLFQIHRHMFLKRKLLRKISAILKDKQNGLTKKDLKDLKHIHRKLKLAVTAEELLVCWYFFEKFILSG